MFDALVTLMTFIALGFVVVWWRYPDVRVWMEVPKYRLATRARDKSELRVKD